MWADCLYKVERVTWKGNIPQQGDLIQVASREDSMTATTFSRPQGELPPSHLNPSHSFIRGLSSLLIYRLIGPNAFSPPPQSSLVLSGSTLYWIYVKLYIHDHVGHKSQRIFKTITRECFNQQLFTLSFQGTLSTRHIDWNFQSRQNKRW